jgi:PTH1 family peptidyl-tRNA hydrolase
MKIIVGIGNPGKDYENTRHNLGFLIVDEIASELNLEFKKNRFGGQYCRGEGVVLVKPQNYVNNSGECVASFMNFYRSRIDEILIIYDDISLPLSKTRYSVGGAGNGHNGIKSISRCLGGKKFPQLRVGISHDKRYLLAD